ncbi:unnamed protein product [Macrosiphum euphorbiae]|uniref:Uncharacterized protein n=1 Tax=Macrosiphum euphorbiae TaxID=13131 RepID=A0AAV0Y7X6_9HEMI|nr:unnamed protein product [Macrosiphum euphorbiae]
MKPLHLMSRRHYNRTVSSIYHKEGSSINLPQSISAPNMAALVKFACTEETPSSNETLNNNNFNLDLQPGKLDIFTNDNNTCSNEYVTYNVHGLIHIANFVKIHGPLDKFSVFKFENFLQIIKKTVHSSKYPLQDVYNRILEQNIYLETNIKYP